MDKEEQQQYKDLRIQAMLRGLVKQLDQGVIGDQGVLQEYFQWVVERMDALIKLAGEEETKRRLREIKEEVTKALEKHQQENEGFSLVTREILQLMRRLIL